MRKSKRSTSANSSEIDQENAYITLCSHIKAVTYYIRVFLEDELISTGTAIAIDERGDLLTALHVITSRAPIRSDDLNMEDIIILAQDAQQQIFQYVPIPHLYGIGLAISGLQEPIYFDLAVLRSFQQRSVVAFSPISNRGNVVGKLVLLAGFPDDMETPFSIDRRLDRNRSDMVQHINDFDQMRRPLMIKSGMIGNATGFVFSDNAGIKAEGDIIYIDNVLHSGASGGPVINNQGEVIGIITERAITRVSFEDLPGLRIPSGSAVAISPRCMKPFIDRYGSVK